MQCNVCDARCSIIPNFRTLKLECNHVVHFKCLYHDDIMICPVCGDSIDEKHAFIMWFYKSQSYVDKYLFNELYVYLFLISVIGLIWSVIIINYNEYYNINPREDIKSFVGIGMMALSLLIQIIMYSYSRIGNKKKLIHL